MLSTVDKDAQEVYYYILIIIIITITIIITKLLLATLSYLSSNNCPSSDVNAFITDYLLPQYITTTYSFSTNLLAMTNFNDISGRNDIVFNNLYGIKRSIWVRSYGYDCSNSICYGMLKNAPVLRDFQATLTVYACKSLSLLSLLLLLLLLLLSLLLSLLLLL